MSTRRAGLSLAALLALGGGASAQDAAALNPMHGVDRSALNGFVELPLFDPARRLPPPVPPAPVVAEAPAAAPPEPPPSLQLVGIVRGRRDLAIVHQSGVEKTVILRNGETFGDWTVAVQPLGVTLRNGGRSVTYSIFARTAAPAPAQPPQSLATSQPLRRPPDE